VKHEERPGSANKGNRSRLKSEQGDLKKSRLMVGATNELTGRNERDELKVFISHRASVCGECHSELGHQAWVFLAGDRGALCLSCADLDHLVFLPAGDTAVTRRARELSKRSAVVLEWSRARKRYGRKGLLVEEEALHEAEASFLAADEVRARRRDREAARRAERDQEFVGRFADRVRALFPGCPAGRETVIAERACEKYSGRVGRSAAAKDLDEEAVRMAVVAHVRHRDTDYDEMLARGEDRQDARARVRHEVQAVLERWTRPAR
jgi:hypothetical protein